MNWTLPHQRITGINNVGNILSIAVRVTKVMVSLCRKYGVFLKKTTVFTGTVKSGNS